MSYAPNVPPLLLYAEKAWLQGTLVAGVAYGVVLTLFSICVPHLAAKPKRNYPHAKRRWWLLLYISACFILGTLNIASEAKMAQLAFIDNRNYPGGPAMYEIAMYAIPVSSMSSVGFVLTNWSTDCLLIWRCLVIYRGCMDQLGLAMIGPVLMLITSIVTGTLWLLQVTKSSPWSSGPAYTMAYAISTLSINVIVPLMIVIRLAVHRRRVVKALGVQHGEHYVSIISMFIESASLVSLFVIFFLVPFVMNSPIAIVAIQVAPQIQIIASLLIIFRVAQGKDWSPATGVVTQDVEAAMSRVGETNLEGHTNTSLHEDTTLLQSMEDHRLGRLVHESHEP